MNFAVGYRTIICAVLALLTQVCTALGIDLAAILQLFGVVPDQLADQASAGGAGLANSVVTILFLIGVVFFKWLANRRAAGKPPISIFGMQLAIACLAISLLSLAGCKTLQIPEPVKPETVKQSLATAWLAHGAANKNITDLRLAKVITATQFKAWAADLDKTEEHLRTADRLFTAGDFAGADTWLGKANALINILESLIQEKLDELARSPQGRGPGGARGARHAGDSRQLPGVRLEAT